VHLFLFQQPFLGSVHSDALDVDKGHSVVFKHVLVKVLQRGAGKIAALAAMQKVFYLPRRLVPPLKLRHTR